MLAVVSGRSVRQSSEGLGQIVDQIGSVVVPVSCQAASRGEDPSLCPPPCPQVKHVTLYLRHEREEVEKLLAAGRSLWGGLAVVSGRGGHRETGPGDNKVHCMRGKQHSQL